MKVFFHKHFRKRFAKLPSKIKDKFDIQLELFYKNLHDERLNNHELHGKYINHRSINVTGDIRAVYRKTDTVMGSVLFVDIGTHPELYS
ncbi:MAG: hypothetical protein COV32_02825 [Candidatus Yonathbacteria bacterium CG10_big_fil_rev_8_21_14_0_10_43_136]|uniref:Type II toxin-antitoxin system mRNA interferase toxin, RelE/StbE family n=2 Tax=Parcubacteria group TaxID=1794811 RepID=A0A2M7Q3Z9_9BACT|nr:MAG: hypothetical protein AUK15_02370 [Candidatus Nomurabacteria bacterium CG2_30_43_9]PIQ35654.1 MAG: hypothetical protein COW60_02755 [Candidatus Yonathbacteria bacterium CG17_big_fil_post_rev_8_21_14_2_50_43_9]PIR40547.1 MAG: hypothetical protein COV32_02825 [Candidatus Yonathbacteria bacterium CG10_big_fil_rev_8_21_14_0_10_43_136]PIX57046.1 MAG: hypothetical protein COZ48_02790 [Candidatus Yonathbacteria bacterium CG_4_10_14_3_um_filter_43_12]PIY58146.1 MAG: hypothetical protein COY98_03